MYFYIINKMYSDSDIIQIRDKRFENYIGTYELNSIVKDIGLRINEDYKNVREPLIIISVLNGAFMFCSDVVKMLDIECEVQFIKLASYDGVRSTGNVIELIGLTGDIKGRDVLIIEDIIDSGRTMVELLNKLMDKGAKSIEICTLLYKEVNCKEKLKIKYVGRVIEDKFVVGYGLDYNNLGRNINAIYSLLENNNISLFNNETSKAGGHKKI